MLTELKSDEDGAQISQIYADQLEIIKMLSDRLIAPQTAMFADEVAASIPKLTLARAADKSSEIMSSLRRELSTEHIFVVERQWSKFLDADETIAATLENAFPRAAFDFLEARKCLCFGRATAAVMHLMRCLEAPLSLLASELGVTIADEDTWGAILSKCRIEIRNRDSGKGVKWATHNERRFFHEAADALRHIQIATRDPSFHAVKEKWTPEEARLEYENTRKFLLHMASRTSSDQLGPPS